jgi:hypothetical protein
MKRLSSVSVSTLSGWAGAEKLGQPVPLSNLVADVNRGLPHPAHR